MSHQSISASTPDGNARGELFLPEGKGPFPLVVYIPDAGGLRAATAAMGERIAGQGYAVLQVDPFWRSAPYAPFDFTTVFGDPTERARLMAIMGRVKIDEVVSDLLALVDAIADARVVKSTFATMGYCMGGRLAFVVATRVPERVTAVAAFHPGGLVTDKPDSPHLSADRLKARVYLGIAHEDASCSPEHQRVLHEVLSANNVDYALEVYAAKHGFAMTDFPVHDAAAEARHWTRLFEWLAA